jgi:hypothetical protein
MLSDSCGNPKLPRRVADDPLEVKGKMALVGEADAQRDLRQAELAVSSEELLRSFNATSDHVLAKSLFKRLGTAEEVAQRPAEVRGHKFPHLG